LISDDVHVIYIIRYPPTVLLLNDMDIIRYPPTVLLLNVTNIIRYPPTVLLLNDMHIVTFNSNTVVGYLMMVHVI
jgi:hypothetical protein